ncbi:MAG: alpha-mannosidase [Provencibacterium sp.]|jgi:alpha-mannosidase|nr:alpha-mannosidase [Provencibacterium sp.]
MAKKSGSWQRSALSFTGKLRARMFGVVRPLEGWTITPARYSAPGKTERTGPAKPIRLGESWFSETAYFENRFRIPEEFQGQEVWLRFQNQGESLLYRDGLPVSGLDPNRTLCSLGVGAGQEMEISVESTLRWQNFAHARQVGMDYGFQVFSEASLVTIEENIRFCSLAAEALGEYLAASGSRWAEELLNELRIRVKPDSAPECLAVQAKQARAWLEEELARSRAAKGEAGQIFAVGHSHLDLAYLWPAKETVRKCGRTFSNMLQLLDRFPDYRFSQSQSYLYEAAKTFYPVLYERVKRYVAEGRWEPVGGMYVEPDGNMPDGESFIRQFLYGEGILQREFGRTTAIGWLPDTFGQSAILPQIMRGCGVRFYYSAKLRGNEQYDFPYSSYWWEGLDGSRVLSLLDPYESYHGDMSFRELKKGQETQRAQQEEFPETPLETMYCFGYGDGGGGATQEMLEKRALFDAAPGFPSIRCAAAAEFFEKLEQKAGGLPVWYGEHYFDQHQGTLTSHALLKKLNRTGETALRDAEFLLALAGSAGNFRQELDGLWKTLLFNQFHDILPGSHQKCVFETAAEEGQRMVEGAKALQRRAVESMSRPDEERLALFNTLSFVRQGAVDLPAGSARTVLDLHTGERFPIQRRKDGSGLFLAKGLPPAGYRAYRLSEEESEAAGPLLAREESDAFLLENAWIRARISKTTGALESLVLKEEDRELLQAGGGRLELYDELYENYDAWNLHPETLRHPAGAAVQTETGLLENGPLEARVRIVKRFSQSELIQEAVLRADSARLDFVTEVEWRETGRLLRAVLDTGIFSPKAAYDLSYGNLERSTRNNSGLERSQIETAAHKWADLSDGGCGLALLSDCKYGYSVKGSRMTLTLLKAAKYPDPECDMGRHRFTYALYPHRGDFRSGGVDKEGLALNVPVHSFAAALERDSFSALETGAESVFLGALKPAADGDGLILRLYENHGKEVCAAVRLRLPFARAYLCDMLENPEEELAVRQGTLRMRLRPYEIKTVRLTLS